MKESNLLNYSLFHVHIGSFEFSADIISTVEFNHDGELLATGDKGGRVVIFQREPEVCSSFNADLSQYISKCNVFFSFGYNCVKA